MEFSKPCNLGTLAVRLGTWGSCVLRPLADEKEVRVKD
jgi:hypothetical protein